MLRIAQECSINPVKLLEKSLILVLEAKNNPFSLKRARKIIADNPQLILIGLGLFIILTGWALGVGWIIVLGLLIVILGIVSKKSRGEISRSPIHY